MLYSISAVIFFLPSAREQCPRAVAWRSSFITMRLILMSWKNMNFNESCYNKVSTVRVANEIVICPRAARWIKYLALALKIVVERSDKRSVGSGNVRRLWGGFGLPWRSIGKERGRESCSALCSITHVCSVCQHWALLNKARQELTSRPLTRI